MNHASHQKLSDSGAMTRAAIAAARLGARRPAVVEVELIQEGSTLHLTVADSGDGVALDRDAVFVEGVSTRSLIDAPGGRGVGLALSRQIARSRGGDIVIAHMGGQELDDNVRGGAVFIARMPEVLGEQG